jgi:hypothetical protein
MGVSGQRHAPAALLPPGKGPPVPIVQEAGCAPEPVWTEVIGKILRIINLFNVGDLRNEGKMPA